MNPFKNPLGISLGLLLLAVVAYFYTVEAPKLTTVTTKKEVAVRATAINYEGAMVVSEVDDIDDILAELDANPPAGGATFDMATMARSITAEALKAFSDSKERALPLTAHWNVGESEGMDPMYMLSRIELGEHILVSWKLDPYYSDNIGSSYYEESVKKAAELNLPLVFVLPAPESALTKENYYRSLEPTENPNVVDTNGDILEKLSPFGPDELWSEMGEQWASTALMAQLQEWYPNPPLVVFVSKDEADKLLWSELETSSRYQENYPAGKDDSFKRTLVGAKWIEKYRQMHDGFKKGFTQTAWKENVKFLSYNKLSDNLGTSNEWINNATLTNQYMNVWPLTADGVTIDFNLLGDKSDTSANAPHILANNLPFMLSEAKLQNPSFSYQLSIDDNEKVTDVARYRGLTQFALWFLRPSTIRQTSTATTTQELEPMYQELSDSVELIHYNEQLASFWRDAELVSTGESDLNQNIPNQYQNDPRAFLLETDANPEKPWDENTDVKVWAFALVKGEAPNREWLVYVQSPEGDKTDVRVTIPEYKDLLVDSSRMGDFYAFLENKIIKQSIVTHEFNKLSLPLPMSETPLPTRALDVTSAVDMTPHTPLTGDGMTDETELMKIIAADTSITNWYFPSGKTFRLRSIAAKDHVKAIFGGGTINSIDYNANDGYPYGAIKIMGIHQDLVIDGLTFFIEGRVQHEAYGQVTFSLVNATNTQIRNCTFISTDAYAVSLKVFGTNTYKIDGIYIYNNKFIDSQAFAIEIFEITTPKSSDGTDAGINNAYVFNNTINGKLESQNKGSSGSISIANVRLNTHIYNNEITYTALGLESHATDNCHYYNNIIKQTVANKYPILIGGSGEGVIIGNNNSIHNNYIEDSAKTAIFYIYRGFKGKVYENFIDTQLRINAVNTDNKANDGGEIYNNTFTKRSSGAVIATDIKRVNIHDNNIYLVGSDTNDIFQIKNATSDVYIRNNNTFSTEAIYNLMIDGANSTEIGNSQTPSYKKY